MGVFENIYTIVEDWIIEDSPEHTLFECMRWNEIRAIYLTKNGNKFNIINLCAGLFAAQTECCQVKIMKLKKQPIKKQLNR